MSLGDLSIIMMTGNRPRMFHDVIEQYATTAPGLTIHAADFGDRDAQRQNAEAAARFPHAVRHYAFAPGTPWQERFNQLLAACETTYVVMAADDDLLLPDGLRESVAFLEEHPDYGACHGIYYALANGPQPASLAIGISCGFIGRAYESPDAVGRLLAFMYWYQSTYYAVQRRVDLKRMIVPPEVHTGAMTELFTGCVTVISGKVARLRSPYCIRNAVPTDIGARVTEFADVIMSGGERLMDEYLPMRAALAEMLREQGGKERDWPRMIDIAFASHVRKHWREAWVWSKMADAGDISREDVTALCAAGIESEAIPIPAEYLVNIVQPLLARGWPSFG